MTAVPGSPTQLSTCAHSTRPPALVRVYSDHRLRGLCAHWGPCGLCPSAADLPLASSSQGLPLALPNLTYRHCGRKTRCAPDSTAPQMAPPQTGDRGVAGPRLTLYMLHSPGGLWA